MNDGCFHSKRNVSEFSLSRPTCLNLPPSIVSCEPRNNLLQRKTLHVSQLIAFAFFGKYLAHGVCDCVETFDTRAIFLHVSGRGNVFLCSDPNIVVTPEDIDRVVGKLEQDGKFGDDNRVGFPDQLHRVSVLRRKHVSAERFHFSSARKDFRLETPLAL